MSTDPKDYGILYSPVIKLHRQYFKEMTKLLGIQCQYFAPKEDKSYNTQGDLTTNYYPPETVGCIFQEYPDQISLKKHGWVAELQENSSIIHVPYDLANLEVGALFSVPTGLDGAPNRLFRVIKMQTIMIYPASITCEIAPEYLNSDTINATQEFKNSTNNVLVDYEEDD